MGISDIYDRDGNPITWDQWSALIGDDDYRRVGLTEVGPYVISTVWLGMDHNFMGGGMPIIFETMVFTTSAWEADRTQEDPEPLLDIDVRRYSTLSEAQEGHQATVLLVEASLGSEPPAEAPEGSSGPPGPVQAQLWCI